MVARAAPSSASSVLSLSWRRLVMSEAVCGVGVMALLVSGYVVFSLSTLRIRCRVLRWWWRVGFRRWWCRWVRSQTTERRHRRTSASPRTAGGFFFRARLRSSSLDSMLWFAMGYQSEAVGVVAFMV
ncbi:hypothetical protein IGI04_014292 [Brassica rapa subsp. trilocularis]|uniref:Uncharacterized protein n=1 Tax=Brassica rapa subsp. trilocularis TaxID=1813537 RepID=A0ABQ7MP91_BRACM|nr:hypothetical protein IGI04_014292 [Brassica rapa subsp. trilocularis]